MKKRLPWIMTDFSRRISEVPTRAWILLGLVALTFAIYGQTAWHPFIDLDDDVLIYGNPHVRSGLTWENIRWAFTETTGVSMWHPLTWLSYMIDVDLFGLNAGGHHLVSAGIHALNAMLLFLVLQRMTGAPWRSGLVAALFAVHPLHVESVAWAAERKDVLSALFFLLSLWAYVRYAERPVLRRYLGVVVFLGMSLMSKPMAVTMPFTLLLLDWWPLGRIVRMSHEGKTLEGRFQPVPRSRILWEKVPLLAMAAGSAAVTLGAGEGSSWVMSLGSYPLWVRAANAVASYGMYLCMTVWPTSLAVFYPHPGRGIALWKVAAWGLFLAGATYSVVRLGKRRPYLPVGWFFYLGTLVPVIGLVQVGSQAMADRFTYVPLIGVFLMVAWGIPEMALPARRYVTGVLAGTGILALTAIAWVQTGYWRNPVSLYSHAVQVSDNNWFAWHNLGTSESSLGRYANALVAFQEAVRIKPTDADAWTGMGICYRHLRLIDKAIDAYREAIRIKPANAEAWNNLGNIYQDLGEYSQAIEAYREALRIRPDLVDAWFNLGNVFSKRGEPAQANEVYQHLLQLYRAKAVNPVGR